ncbi:FecR family protein [Chitinophaga niabensis]|uniref:Ferric-dicitrate binding protein FerR, regulates iron transport through sigma-19 n=1 Tax=Chitinophaga niabensis TaxID=536979 RepID=A0A1N6GD44_9BACT|nr:FecR domain-containing protein [Chitinophaga niabensis]SIO05450.1 ferric-dicitrate binding protein FerR, regulates iron transport through sigma-19 [Chitinophaga niabensis]
MNDTRLFVLLGKKLNKEASEAELSELEELIRQNAVQPYTLEALQEIWMKKAVEDEPHLEERWERTAQRLNTYIAEPRKRFLPGRIAAAAALTGAIAFAAWFGYRNYNNHPLQASVPPEQDSIITVLNGERKRFVLPDGTQVNLNSGSQLRFHKDFGQQDREIWLNGEAFFDVSKDATHPFHVYTDRMTVKVLGTSFNVKSYNTFENIETTVISGKVEVSLKESKEKKVILLPNEKISLKNNILTKNKADQPISDIQYEVHTVKAANNETIPEEAVWVKEKLAFTDESFDMVALKMERWHNVKFHFANDNLKDLRLNGDFDNVSIEETMHILQMMVHFKYEMTGNNIYIR